MNQEFKAQGRNFQLLFNFGIFCRELGGSKLPVSVDPCTVPALSIVHNQKEHIVCCESISKCFNSKLYYRKLSLWHYVQLVFSCFKSHSPLFLLDTIATTVNVHPNTHFIEIPLTSSQYMVILVFLFILLFAFSLAALCITKAQQKKALQTGWMHSGSTTRDTLQRYLNCCGFENKNLTDGALGHPSCAQVMILRFTDAKFTRNQLWPLSHWNAIVPFQIASLQSETLKVALAWERLK